MNRPSEPGFASVAAVAGLARELEGLRRTIGPLAGLSGQVDDLARVVAQLAETVSVLTARPAGVVAPSWLMVPAETGTAFQVLDDLTSWVGAVYLRYTTTRQSLPECWCWHPEVVEELLWLRSAWRAAYQGRTASAAAAGDWHERLRPGVARRISQLSIICRPESHIRDDDGRPVPDDAPAVPPVGVVELVAQWWAAHRTVCGPEPAPDERSASTGDGQLR